MERANARVAGWAAAVLVLLAPPAHAYVDPGTTNVAFSLFSYLAPLLGALGVALGFVLRPVRRVFGRLLRRIGWKRAAPEVAPGVHGTDAARGDTPRADGDGTD